MICRGNSHRAERTMLEALGINVMDVVTVRKSEIILNFCGIYDIIYPRKVRMFDP